MTDRRHPKEAICAKQKEVTEQNLRNFATGVKIGDFGLWGVRIGDPLRVIQWSPALHD